MVDSTGRLRHEERRLTNAYRNYLQSDVGGFKIELEHRGGLKQDSFDRAWEYTRNIAIVGLMQTLLNGAE